jgi:hypothetical protein
MAEWSPGDVPGLPPAILALNDGNSLFPESLKDDLANHQITGKTISPLYQHQSHAVGLDEELVAGGLLLLDDGATIYPPIQWSGWHKGVEL